MADHPILSVIIPTQGRASLSRTLQSIRQQATEDDVEIIVVHDTHQEPDVIGAAIDLECLAATYRSRYAQYDAGFHHWGHPQCQHGMSLARGHWLAFLGDDDEYIIHDAPSSNLIQTLPAVTAASPYQGMIGAMLWYVLSDQAVNTPVLLFRADHQRLQRTIWETRELREGNVTGQNIVVANDPSILGKWGTEHSSGDWEFIRSTAEIVGHDRVKFVDMVTVRCH